MKELTNKQLYAIINGMDKYILRLLEGFTNLEENILNEFEGMDKIYMETYFDSFRDLEEELSNELEELFIKIRNEEL